MRAWQTPTLLRYLAYTRRDPADVPAPTRPSEHHIWVNGEGWRIAPDVEEREADEAINTIPLFVLEIMFTAENDKRELRRQINLLRPNTYTALQSMPVNHLQYRAMLRILWRLDRS